VKLWFEGEIVRDMFYPKLANKPPLLKNIIRVPYMFL
jgi:hypothetical protein